VFLNLENGPRLIFIVAGLSKGLATDSQHQHRTQQTSTDVMANQKHAYRRHPKCSPVANHFQALGHITHLSNVRGKQPVVQLSQVTERQLSAGITRIRP